MVLERIFGVLSARTVDGELGAADPRGCALPKVGYVSPLFTQRQIRVSEYPGLRFVDRYTVRAPPSTQHKVVRRDRLRFVIESDSAPGPLRRPGRRHHYLPKLVVATVPVPLLYRRPVVGGPAAHVEDLAAVHGAYAK